MSRLLQAAFIFTGLMCFTGTAAAGPPDEKPSHVDCYGDPLPEGVIARMGSIRFKQRTKNFPSEVAFSPDSKILAVTFSDEAGCGVLLREVATGKVIRKLDVPGNVSLEAIMFSPDGKLLALPGAREIFILETDRDTAFGRFIKYDGPALCAFLPDNKTLVTASRQESHDHSSVRLWDLTTGREPVRLRGSEGPIRELRISKDGKELTSYGDGFITVWGLPAGTLLHRRKVKEGLYALSRDFRFGLFEDDSGSAAHQLWDLDSNQKLWQFCDTEAKYRLAPDGRVLVKAKQQMSLLDAVSKKELVRLQDTSGLNNWGTHFSEDGRMLAVWNYGGNESESYSLIRLWDVATGKELHKPSGHLNDITKVAVTPDGRYAISASSEPIARLWEMRTGRQLCAFDGSSDPILDVAISPDGKTAATMNSSGICHLWDTKTGKPKGVHNWRRPCKDPESPNCSHQAMLIGFCTNGKMLMAGDAGQMIHVIDVSSDKELSSFQLVTSNYLVQISPNGQYLATAEWPWRNLPRQKRNTASRSCWPSSIGCRCPARSSRPFA